LVDVLKKMRSENTKLAAVISETGRYIGVVFARDVESRIADSVLNTSKG
jgi:CBS domain containing-hemolysin-like protein